jgi:hypothetical protein
LDIAKERLPKVGDRVSASRHHGAFVVFKVFENQTAFITKIGTRSTRYVADWKDLRFLDEEDASQAAALNYS